MKPKGWWIIAAALVVVLAGVGYWWFHTYLKAYHGYTPLSFSTEAWASADAETRGHMVRDLQRRKLLDHKTRQEVENLLGPPDHSGTEDDDGRIILYTYDVGYMGFNPYVAFAYELRVQFDEQGLVDEMYVDD